MSSKDFSLVLSPNLLQGRGLSRMSRQSEARQSEDAVLWVLVLQNGSILQCHTAAFLQELQTVLCCQIYGILVSLQDLMFSCIAQTA